MEGGGSASHQPTLPCVFKMYLLFLITFRPYPLTSGTLQSLYYSVIKFKYTKQPLNTDHALVKIPLHNKWGLKTLQ